MWCRSEIIPSIVYTGAVAYKARLFIPIDSVVESVPAAAKALIWMIKIEFYEPVKPATKDQSLGLFVSDGVPRFRGGSHVAH